MKKIQQFLALSATITFITISPLSSAHAGAYVGWNVSVGSGYRPAAYGPGWGGWGPGWHGGPYYAYPYGAYYGPPIAYGPPAVAYVQPAQPLVLAAQPEPPVWYYCQSSGKYYPYAQECASGWQVQPATPPAGKPSPQSN
jgi:hypothetical protein